MMPFILLFCMTQECVTLKSCRQKETFGNVSLEISTAASRLTLHAVVVVAVFVQKKGGQSIVCNDENTVWLVHVAVAADVQQT